VRNRGLGRGLHPKSKDKEGEEVFSKQDREKTNDEGDKRWGDNSEKGSLNRQMRKKDVVSAPLEKKTGAKARSRTKQALVSSDE